jgi:hypothetical protein
MNATASRATTVTPPCAHHDQLVEAQGEGAPGHGGIAAHTSEGQLQPPHWQARQRLDQSAKLLLSSTARPMDHMGRAIA